MCTEEEKRGAATTSLIAIEDFNHDDFLVVAEIKVRCVRANESSGDVDDNLMSAAEGRKRRQNDDQVKVESKTWKAPGSIITFLSRSVGAPSNKREIKRGSTDFAHKSPQVGGYLVAPLFYYLGQIVYKLAEKILNLGGDTKLLAGSL